MRLQIRICCFALLSPPTPSPSHPITSRDRNSPSGPAAPVHPRSLPESGPLRRPFSLPPNLTARSPPTPVHGPGPPRRTLTELFAIYPSFFTTPRSSVPHPNTQNQITTVRPNAPTTCYNRRPAIPTPRWQTHCHYPLRDPPASGTAQSTTPAQPCRPPRTCSPTCRLLADVSPPPQIPPPSRSGHCAEQDNARRQVRRMIETHSAALPKNPPSK
ncbi:unnamed protein product [Pleuronectes platessa]|uniref:Uncharacterized protein n=1 Tax=Pleuronectes platessa TaxID=8262 RepID=A0A9N7W2L3_PLEPL|nr:unnamed protein product [Pleuronectes platessa]